MQKGAIGAPPHQRVIPLAGEEYVVEDGDVEEFPALLHVLGQLQVCCTGLEIARGVDVGEDDAGGAGLQSCRKDELGVGDGAGDAPGGDFVNAKHLVGPVEEQDLELLDKLDAAHVPAGFEHLVAVGGEGNLRSFAGLDAVAVGEFDLGYSGEGLNGLSHNLLSLSERKLIMVPRLPSEPD